ncbi:hypothetical protein FRACYDRAFT_233608 [Fragilariopsis cylindrus CCMP1102]|uniref:Uncharacterized protein n=1 Tax=Fragilariopsis cylindrus CCMP1102 TaxID=635003 RepID=A0A1E7FZ60_9STRA|nr:hypothetical protein FRACYDRAFT_233608 [Fragilariopsis cylindrus CCMP1102]|eukprot:OEU23437.1 hypothetical protein FRACYDRAFT_233608 [Fragilariopsis cylindrus CCMP1102]
MDDEHEHEHEKDDAIILPTSRPLLIFNHNPKAGGGSVLKIIRGFKINEIKCKVALRNKYTGKINPSGCKSNQWDHISSISSSSTSSLNNTFINNGEFSRTTHQDKDRGYIIGTIREPCSQYVSLWSFGSLGHGQFRNQILPDTELYGTSPPYFNTTDDIQRFHKWMNHTLVIAEIGRRVNVSYGSDDENDSDNVANIANVDLDSSNDNIVNNVDCWVVVENFQQTLFECLNRYEDQGGYVDWTSETLSQLKDEVEEEKQKQKQIEVNSHHHYHHHLRGRSRELRYYTVTKDDPLGDPRSKHHASCGVFFAQNDDLVQQVMSPKSESFIYKQFGYDGCCNPGSSYLGSPSSFTLTSTTTNKSTGIHISLKSIEARKVWKKVPLATTTTTTTTISLSSFGSNNTESTDGSSSLSSRTTTTTMDPSFIPSMSSIFKHDTTTSSIFFSLLLAGGFSIMIYRFISKKKRTSLLRQINEQTNE